MLAGCGLAWLLWPNVHEATATPEPGLEVTLAIWPMPSLHSDWNRKITVAYDGAQITQRLFEDTGWWRGSNLYRHTSGAYVLNEGQAGCIGVSLEPLAFYPPPAGACTKREPHDRTGEGQSLYSADLVYIGSFSETWRDPGGIRIRYSDASKTPEIELPDPL